MRKLYIAITKRDENLALHDYSPAELYQYLLIKVKSCHKKGIMYQEKRMQYLFLTVPWNIFIITIRNVSLMLFVFAESWEGYSEFFLSIPLSLFFFFPVTRHS